MPISVLKAIGILILVGRVSFLSAQNLVPNPSFEVFKKKPCQFLIFIPNDSTSQNLSEYVVDWYAPTGGTTDPWFYSDTLANSQTSPCTQNLKRLSRKAHTGNRCIGIDSSVLPPGINSTTSYREYAQVKLTEPLKKGVIYSVEFFVLRSPEAGTASNNLGALFSTKPLQVIDRDFRTFGRPLLAGRPQINQQTVISNTNEWVQIKACFQADSAYQFITLGNFFTDQQTNFISYPGFGNQSSLCYYLIDDISVTAANSISLLPDINLGRDTTLCPNTTYRIDLPQLKSGHYQWQDGDTTTHYTIKQSGTYWVKAISGLCVSNDSVKVQFEPPLVLPMDTVICSGEIFWLKPTGLFSKLLWNDGTQGDSILIKQTGVYWVQTMNSLCTLSDSIHVKVFDCPENVPNVFTPNGDGKNETFTLKNIDLAKWELQIFNRWGANIYQSYPYHNEWTGNDSPSGTYYYLLKSPELKRSLKGWVTIVR